MTETTAVNSPVAPAVNPGKTLGIVGLVLSILQFNVVSLVISIIALVKSKKAGMGNGFAIGGIIISILSIIGGIILIVVVVGAAAALSAQCAEVGPGIWELDNGLTVTCP
ncbi:hypothetical protein [Homoserinimonas hongtaonis]|uniref:hypothetical protein n=1 Tax=Homoserinimonas hongtaonis TaxID=2079791 RepID=UPI000D3D8EBC|nr:hypothetical protein [Salinibacterium hongtaonis]AWB88190.1 hypothetical protein C2138_00275 [Salinibacterium hongtaonis]